MSDEALRAKFMDCVAKVPEVNGAALHQTLSRLEALTSVGELVRAAGRGLSHS